LGDFFLCDFDQQRFDAIYERAFLCSLPRRLWARYAARVSELLRPDGVLIGLFYFDAKEEGPPFGLRPGEIQDLFRAYFAVEVDEPARSSAPIFAGKERWQQRRRLG